MRASTRLYAICKGGGRRNASTCSSTVPRGDTPCVTAGDAQRANPWKVDKTILRHRRCRTAATPYPSEFLPQRLQCDAAGVGVLSILFSTGSPFGRHPRLSMVRLRWRREWICADAQCLQYDAAGVGVLPILFSTGSPFGRHPRLNMVRLRWRREWICAVAQRLQCDATRGESISVWMLLRRRGGERVYRLYTICKNRGRRSSG